LRLLHRRAGIRVRGANLPPMSPGSGHPPRARKGSPPVEYSLLLTATLCLLAFGVVMVFSASSTAALLGEAGDGAYYLKRTALFGAAGLLLLHVLSVYGARPIRLVTPLILAAAVFLLVAVLVPGVGLEINGARRWIGGSLIQIQPSELAKLAVILYGAHLLASRPQMVTRIGTMGPYLAVVAVVCGLVVLEPDLGTAIVVCLAAAALLLAAGARVRDLVLLGGVLGVVVLLAIAIEPYRMDRLTGFLHPGADPGGIGFQANQAEIALGSGGILGVGLGESIQKAFYLPEAHTDMIAAVIGEELGLVGIIGLVGLYGMFGYAGLRIAQRARDRYGKLLAAGLTSLVLVQAMMNLFAAFGLAPLTGVPLPFVSYGNSSMLVMLAAVGLLLNVSRGGTVGMTARSTGARSSRGRDSTRRARDATLRAVDKGSGRRPARAPQRRRSSRTVAKAQGRDSRRGNRGTRGSGTRRRRRAAG
jgi:cell division protein FtsW